MQANIELALKTREVYKLFERKINGDRLFIDAILHKFNLIMSQSKQQSPNAQIVFEQVEQAMLLLDQQFNDEIHRFEEILARQKHFNDKKINFLGQYCKSIPVSNPLSIHLIKFVETYDKLTALLKLLHMAGCFASNNDYYANLQRIQKLTNQMLSRVVTLPIARRTIVRIQTTS